MDTYPLIRTKLSNEHIMAALFIVLVLYQLPQFVQAPESILRFLAVLALGLFLDTTINIIRYKRPVCAVSAAVTSAMLQVLTPGISLWGKLIGISAALILGKHVWGGTGKNVINPAVTGLVLVGLLFPTTVPFFNASVLLIPAVVLSLPFMGLRPFAAAGFILGMTAALLTSGNLNVISFISFGAVFWGCLVMTDPVTITRNPLAGAILGIAVGFIPVYLPGSVLPAALGILGVNVVSFITDRLTDKSYNTSRFSFRKKEAVPFMREKTVFRDLSGIETESAANVSDLTADEILQRIKDNGVFGFGGAAYPAYEKIKAVMESNTSEKHFIINGVECDPGLIHDKWILRQYPCEIYKGIEVLCRCLKFDSVTLAVKDSDGLTFPEGLRVHKVPDFYPAGAERVLIKEVLGKTLEYNEIPAFLGILILNVQTVLSIYEAVCLNRKADTRFITIADIKNKTAQVVKVKLGTKISGIMSIVHPQAIYSFSGGGCMQARAADEEDIVDKTVNFLATGDFPKYKESPQCSKCGFCTAHCPAGLRVNMITDLVDKKRIEDTRRLHGEKCISCGGCSYVCLAGRNLSARVKTAREYLKGAGTR